MRNGRPLSWMDVKLVMEIKAWPPESPCSPRINIL